MLVLLGPRLRISVQFIIRGNILSLIKVSKFGGIEYDLLRIGDVLSVSMMSLRFDQWASLFD